MPALPHLTSFIGAFSILVLGCAADDVHHPLDFEPIGDDGKADGTLVRFDPNHLISDAAFYDSPAMDAAAVQGFLEDTPYGMRSFLADQRMSDGRSLAMALVDVARRRGINPLVLLATLQKEAGLVSKTQAPSRQLVDYAFGCGCPDGGPCSEQLRGLDKQLDCAADKLAEFTADLEVAGSTISGWAVGQGKKTLDPQLVVPANRATAVLYTYTPWVLPRRGGNWLFWNVWSRYADHVDYVTDPRSIFNEGFIGGNCTSDADCLYDGGRCLFAEPGRRGTCSKSCDGLCPDRAGAFATTFCVGDGSQGFCLARCDLELSPTGCGENQVCVARARHGEPEVVEDVCLPDVD